MSATIADWFAAPRRRWFLAAVLLVAGVFAAVPAVAQVCTGDCNGNGNVSSPELLRAVRIALIELDLGDCSAADVNDDDLVDIVDLVDAVNQRLSGCTFVSPTPTQTSAVPTPTEGPPRPDLAPGSVQWIAPGHGSCVAMPPTAEIEVCIRNLGPGDGIEAQVLVSQGGAPPDVLSLLAFVPGATACGRTSSAFAFDVLQVDVTVDPENLVAETNESNNETTVQVSRNLAPITCSPVPSVTPTPVLTGDETSTPTPTPGEPTATPTRTTTIDPRTSSPTPAAPTQTRTATCACTVSATFTPSRTASLPPSQTPSATASPTPTRTPGRPDLVPNRVILIAPTPVRGCVDNFNEIVLGLDVCVLNDGTGDAGPFQVALRVAAEITIPFEAGIEADTELCVAAPFLDGQFLFDVDTQDQVDERIEDNNVEVFSVVRPTPPPLCATPTATPS